MTSLRTRVVAALVPLDRGSRYVRDVDALRAHVAPGARAASPAPPAWLRRRVRVARGEVAGVRCYRLSPHGGGSAPRAAGGGHVLYLHGGAYVGESSAHHWRFLARLARAARATITVPIYTLAPKATAREVVAEVMGVQRELAAPVVMGDSAGAGLALAAAQAARAQGRDTPRELVLLSPWVDATMTNPGITAVAPRDPVLGIEAVALAGMLYAGADFCATSSRTSCAARTTSPERSARRPTSWPSMRKAHQGSWTGTCRWVSRISCATSTARLPSSRPSRS